MKKYFKYFLTINVLLLAFLILPVFVSAGTINSSGRYAWSENAGWIDFGSTAGNVTVTDSAMTGYAYGENIGWISLNCSNTDSCATVDYKVANNGQGVLSGYAWGENVGWINFAPTASGVTIDNSGNFSGYAYGENVGWISFNCANTSSCDAVSFRLSTNWERASSTALSTSTGGGGNAMQLARIIAQAQTQQPTQQPTQQEQKQILIIQIKSKIAELIQQLILMLQEQLQNR